MKQRTRTFRALAVLFTLFLGIATVESYGQQKPVTTHPGGKKDCKDKIESSVNATPWQLSGMAFITEQTTPIDTTKIVSAAKQLSSAVNGNLENYTAIVDTLKGWMANTTYIGFFQWTRTVTITLKEWKCKDGVLVLVRDINRTFDEKTPWFQFGPFAGSEMSVKKLQSEITTMATTLPAEYEGPIE